MPVEWYLMKQSVYNSGFEGDEFDLFGTAGFEEILESSVASDIAIYEKRIYAEPVLTRAIVQGVTSDTYNNSVLRQFLARIGTFRSGQYIKVGENIWMAYTLPDNNKIYEKVIGWQCRYSIRFVSPLSGKIVEYPVYDINSTQYGSGETEKPRMTIGTSQHLVYIPYNEETIRLDSGFRFLIDKNRENPTAYRLTQVDTGTYSCGENDGVLQWTIVESQFDEKTDNKELMVADYFGKSEVNDEDDTVTGYSIKFSQDDYDVVFGESCRVDFSYLRDGVVTEPFPVDIQITGGANCGNIEKVGETYFVVKAFDNRENIGQDIAVAVRNEQNSLSEQLIIKVKGWY